MEYDVELIKQLAKGYGEYDITEELEENIEKSQLQGLPITEKIKGLSEEKFMEIRSYVHESLTQRLGPEQTNIKNDPIVKSTLRSVVMRALIDKKLSLGEAAANLLVEELGNDLLGLGPIQPFFDDNEVTEIKAQWNIVRVEKNGVEKIVEGIRFRDESHIRDVLERMLAPTGRKIDTGTPEVNARLHDGSRLIAQIPPWSVHGTMLTIRRFRQDMTVENLIKRNVMSPEVVAFLEAAVKAKLNIIISGGTSSGKTTVLNCLASFIPDDESIVTIEEPAELQLQHSNVRSLEANSQTEFTQRRGVQSALRMAPKRIIVGECRGAETFDMLQAMNTGHLGSMTTAHANSAWLLRPRLVNMVQMANMGLSTESIIEQIATAVDLFVHVTKDRTGRRRLDHICEINGTVRQEEGVLNANLNTIWQYNQSKDCFEYVAEKFTRRDKLIEEGGWKI